MAIAADYSKFQILQGMQARWFPKLDLAKAQITSNKTPRYNCFAWAAGDELNKWQPPDYGTPYDYVWFPSNLAFTLATVIENYEYVGFEITNSDKLEIGYEKIAIYIDAASGEPKHAARLKDNGAWTSKIGKLEDIEHATPACMEGDAYGVVSTIMKRVKGDPQAWIRSAKKKWTPSIKTSKR